MSIIRNLDVWELILQNLLPSELKGFSKSNKLFHKYFLLFITRLSSRLKLKKNSGLFDPSNQTLFIEASKNGLLDLVALCCNGGVDINCHNGEAVLFAVWNNHLNVIKYLISKGANIHNNELLVSASFYGHLEIVKYLISNGTDALSRYKALEYACTKGHLHVIKYLIDINQDYINNTINNILKLACEYGYLEIIEYLASKGADIHMNHDELLDCACITSDFCANL